MLRSRAPHKGCHTFADRSYVELEIDIKLNEEVNDVFLPKSTANIRNGSSGVRLSATLRDARQR